MVQKLSSVEAVVDALGGSSAAARLVGASPVAATMWKKRNLLPPEHYLIITSALPDCEIDLALFRMTPPREVPNAAK